jgi:hypothetical protein
VLLEDGVDISEIRRLLGKGLSLDDMLECSRSGIPSHAAAPGATPP